MLWSAGRRVDRPTDRRRHPGRRRTRRARVALLGAAATALAAGCAGPGETEAAVESVVTEFYAAVGASDGQAVCDLLLPQAAEAVAEDAETDCATAVVQDPKIAPELAHRAAEADVTEVHVAGRQAQVVTASDTVFLARSGDAWVVTAAACIERPERPYDCEVQA
jgi:hypothetical protein